MYSMTVKLSQVDNEKQGEKFWNPWFSHVHLSRYSICRFAIGSPRLMRFHLPTLQWIDRELHVGKCVIMF